MIHKARNTEWGRRHGYEHISTLQDFQRQVPISRYEDVAPLWERSKAGERDIIWPGAIPYFALTSGTTTSASKIIPITRESLRAGMRSGAALIGAIASISKGDRLFKGKSLYLSGCTKLERQDASLVGDSSGIYAARLPRLARRFRLPVRSIAEIGDWDERMNAIACAYMNNKVSTIVGMPSWTVHFFERLLQIASEQHRHPFSCIRELWPDFRFFVNFGASFEPFKTLFHNTAGPGVTVLNTYSSSEGGLNAIQDDPTDPGMLLLIDQGVFFEFVRMDDYHKSDPPRFTLEQVEQDTLYAVILTTTAGIWAYDVGDIVRFSSLNPPRIEFAGRTNLMLNVFGERLIEEELDQALSVACQRLNTRASEYAVTTVMPDGGGSQGRHLWFVEFQGTIPNLSEFADAIDDCLAVLNRDYKTHRNNDISLLRPEVVAAPPGTFVLLARRREKLGGQHKIPRVLSSTELVDHLKALAGNKRWRTGI